MANKSRKNLRTLRKRRSLKGGAKYTTAQKNILLDAGFTENFIKMAKKYIGFNMLWNNFQQSGLTAGHYMTNTYNELEIDPDAGITDSEYSSDSGRGLKKHKNKGHKTLRKGRRSKSSRRR
jgi:hypothetical protein